MQGIDVLDDQQVEIVLGGEAPQLLVHVAVLKRDPAQARQPKQGQEVVEAEKAEASRKPEPKESFEPAA
jgi:hypothetical protein